MDVLVHSSICLFVLFSCVLISKTFFLFLQALETKHPRTFFFAASQKCMLRMLNASKNSICTQLFEHRHSKVFDDIYFEIPQCAVHSNTGISADQGLCFPHG